MKRYGLLLCSLPVMFLVLHGCSSLSIQQGGRAIVRLVEGGLVETLVFGGRTTLNMQVTLLEDDETDVYFAKKILTIGNFSPVIGSGFTSRSNIYFEAEIGSYGQARFDVGQEKFHIIWKEIGATLKGNRYASIFSVTVDQVRF